MATHGKARQAYEKAIREHKSFSGSAAIRGIDGKSWSTGRLPEEYVGLYAFSDVEYTVLSYGTPIGWVTKGGEKVIPSVKYSVTTTHHQSLVSVNL